MQAWIGLGRGCCLAGCALLALSHPGEAGAQAGAPAVTPALGSDGQVVVLSRYTSTSSEPPAELALPLQVVVSLSYPRSTVATVGDAVRHTLVRTGYKLAAADALSPEVSAFLSLPLPESQRQIGPYRVQAVLDVLAGPAWVWHSDARTRVVWLSAVESVAATARGSGSDPDETGRVARTAPVHEPDWVVGGARP